MFDTLTRMGASSAGAYEIEKSLRFHSSDSTKLTRTFGTNSSNTTKTLSFWMKRTKLGTYQKPFATTTSGYIESYIRINNDDTLQFEDRDSSSGSTDGRLVTNRKFRDTLSWYHIVLTIDTTNGTAGDRVRIYVNGVRETSFSSTTNPASSYASQFFRSSVDNFIGAGDSYFDGYLAEIHFIDGTALDASSFGEEDATTGQWIPKKYTGAHGTNGFYLNFSDNSNTTAGTLGADSSANSNNWTPTNLSVSAGVGNDSVEDSPTNNYCTLNPLFNAQSSLEPNIGDGALYSDNGGGGDDVTQGTIGVTSGKYYFEATCGSGASGGRHFVGWMLNEPDDGGNRIGGLYRSSGIVTNLAGTTTDHGVTYTTNDVIGCAIDADAGKVYFAKNNTWINSGNPPAGSGEAFTYTAGPALFPGIAFDNNGNTIVWNVNFGQQGFTYTPPTGFKALCTKNLPTPTINKGKDYFNTVLYTGNGASSQAITGLNFQPDFTWFKARTTAGSSQNHMVFDSVRGTEASLWPNDSWAEDSYSGEGVSAFNSNGVTIGDSGNLNVNNDTYAMWAWKETASAGFDIVAYTGTGSSRTVSHNLGVSPEMMIIKNRSDNENWIVYHSGIASDAETDYIILNTDGAAGDDTWLNDTAPTSSQWEYSGGGNSYNDNGDNYIAYLFASVEGYSKVGSYYGNGNNDGTFVYCGFKPQFVLMKRTNSTGPWYLYDTVRDPENVVDLSLYGNTNGDEDENESSANNPKLDVLSNGFKCRGQHSGFNGDNDTHIFLAIAETPFKYANAR